MGNCCGKEDAPKKLLEGIVASNDDYSFIYSVLQALYNLKTFKNFILNDNSQNEIKIGESLKKIFNKDINKDLIKSSKTIYDRIKEYTKNNIEQYPEIILIKILELLNQEQKRKDNNNNITLLTNIQNNLNLNNYNYEEEAFFNYLKLFIINRNYNKIGEYFFMFFQKRITNCFQMINFSYEHKYVFKLNLFDIFNKKSNIGTLSFNKSTMPELNLIECINEYSSPIYSFYNFNQYIEQQFLYSTPAYLIFILNRRGNENCYYFGDFKYSNIIDLSSVILRKDNAKIYKLSSVIKEKRYLIDNNNQNSKNNYDFNYITINIDNNNGKFYYYDINKKKEVYKMFKKDGYYDHILFFKQY